MEHATGNLAGDGARILRPIDRQVQLYQRKAEGFKPSYGPYDDLGGATRGGGSM